MRVKADGSGDPERILNGRVTNERPDLARLDPRAGRCRRTARRWRWSRIGPNPSQSDVVLQFYDLDTKKSTVPKLGETPPLGHQDPTWRPDGKVLLYVRNGRDGAEGRAGHLPLGRRQEEGHAADRARLPRALVLAGRPVHRGDQARAASATTSSILDAANGRELLRRDQRRRVVGAGLVAGRRRDRVPPHPRPDRRPQAGPARRRPRPTGRSRTSSHLTEVSGLDGESRPGWFVPADQLPDRRRRRPPSRRAPSAAAPPRPSDGDLPRAAGGPDRGRRQRPVPRPRPGPGDAARRASRPDLAGVERFAGLHHRGRRRRSPRRSSRTSPSTRRSGRPGWPPSSGSGRAIPADIPVVIDAKRGDIGSTAARHAVALFDRLGADAVTVNPYPGGEAIAPLLERADRFAYVLCRTRTRTRPSSRTSSSRRTRRPAPRPSRSTCASPGTSRAGVPAGRSGWSSARPRRRSCGDPGRRARASASSCPGIGAQGGDDRAGPARRPGDGGAGRRSAGRRPARQRLARHRARPPSETPGDGGPRDPGERLAAAARDWASQTPCATLAGAERAHAASIPRRTFTNAAHRQEQRRPCLTSDPSSSSSSW